MLSLKEGFISMLLCNIYPKYGHVNSTRGVVGDMTQYVLFLKIATAMRKEGKLSPLQTNFDLSDD